MITATTEIKLEAQEPGRTEISCASEVLIVGCLGKFGFGIMKKRAAHLAREFAAAVQQRMQTADA
jgi:carbon monoxide dehydrogenase subunit G